MELKYTNPVKRTNLVFKSILSVLLINTSNVQALARAAHTEIELGGVLPHLNAVIGSSTDRSRQKH